MTDNRQFLLYTAPDGAVKVDVCLRDESVWLTQKALAELFGVKVPAINKHLSNIFGSGELVREATVSKMEIVRPEGAREVTREVEFYNLDAIIAVGYRVNSYQAPTTKEFFATVQNKLHWAITGQTAAELIYAAADASRANMGLATWKHGPSGKILKSDVAVAKNYLNEAHIKELNRIVSAYLDLAENRAERGIITQMAEWVEFLNRFLELSNYPILKDKGKVSALEAKLKAEGQYEVFRQRQDREYISDFDREIKRLEGKK